MATSTLQHDLRGALAEFIALFFFVFFGAGSVSAAARATGGVVEPINYAASFGFAITVLAYSIGDLSGGHINPAVTTTLMVTGNVEMRAGFLYIIAQFLGGILGGATLYGATGEAAYKSGIGMQHNSIEASNVSGVVIAAFEDPTDISCAQGFLFEFMGTLILLFTVFHVAVWAGDKENNDLNHNMISSLAPIPIGLAVFVSHLTLGQFTGCGINPARVLGAVIFEKNFWDGYAGKSCFWIYFIGPLLAALVAPLMYKSLYRTFKAGAVAAKPDDST